MSCIYCLVIVQSIILDNFHAKVEEEACFLAIEILKGSWHTALPLPLN